EFGNPHLEDLDSADGTLLNGAPVRSAPIHSGDIIRVGAVEMALLPGSPDEDPEAADPVVKKLREAREKVEALFAEKAGLAATLTELRLKVGGLEEARDALRREREEDAARHAAEVERLRAERLDREQTIHLVQDSLAKLARETQEAWASGGRRIEEERERARL